MHLKRWITSIVALPFLIYLIWAGGLAFAVFVAAVCLAALWEYFTIVFGAFDEKSIPVAGLAFLAALLMAAAAHFHSAEMLIVVLGLDIVATAALFVMMFKSRPEIIEQIRIQVLGVVYIPLCLSLLILIRKGPEGMLWIFFLLAFIFAGDVSAFYFGTYLGRRKLIPSVSPGKTVEGAAGGLLANILVGAAFKFFLFPHLAWGPCILFFIAIGAAGQLGDLFESGLKRMSGVKDSGFILPGHGGIVDRIDALLFATPVMYFFIVYAGRGL